MAFEGGNLVAEHADLYRQPAAAALDIGERLRTRATGGTLADHPIAAATRYLGSGLLAFGRWAQRWQQGRERQPSAVERTVARHLGAGAAMAKAIVTDLDTFTGTVTNVQFTGSKTPAQLQAEGAKLRRRITRTAETLQAGVDAAGALADAADPALTTARDALNSARAVLDTLPTSGLGGRVTGTVGLAVGALVVWWLVTR